MGDHVHIVRSVRRGKMRYSYSDGRAITDQKEIDRMNRLRIPPGYHDVQISPDPSSKVQAIGYDDRNRQQTMYHPEFVASQQRKKYEALTHFKPIFEAVKRDVANIIAKPKSSRELAIASVINLMIDLNFRIGRDKYVRDNQSYGASTLRCKHLKVKGNEVIIAFHGKRNVLNEGRVLARNLKRHLTELSKTCRPDKQLFKYTDDGKHTRAVTNEDVNGFLRQYGQGVSSKVIRTWQANQSFLDHLNSGSDLPTKQRVRNAVDKAARDMHHTTAVFRKSYLHPDILAHAEKDSGQSLS